MPPHTRTAWFRTLGLLFLVLVGAAVLGAVAGYPWQVLAVVALGVVGWHYWRLHRVLGRLTARQRYAPPDGIGVWNELDRLLHRGQVEMRGRKRRLVEMLRAYRAAAAALPDAIVVVDRNSQRIQWFNETSTPLLGLQYPDDIDAPLVQRLQPLPLAHWLAGGRNAEALDAASRLGADHVVARQFDDVEPAPDPLLGKPVAAGRARCHPVAATGADAPRLRRQRLA